MSVLLCFAALAVGFSRIVIVVRLKRAFVGEEKDLARIVQVKAICTCVKKACVNINETEIL